MARRGALFWPSVEHHSLDEAFDAPDVEADYEMCCAIAAGRRGLHPDAWAWGNHNPLATLPPHFRREWIEPVGFPPDMPRQLPVVKRPEPPKRKSRGRPPNPKPSPAWHWVPQQPAAWERATGEIELTCDECERRFGITTSYNRGGRDAKAAWLRGLGALEGWTHIVGRDRCPQCSLVAAPQQVGNGTGKRQGNEQHADGG